MARGGARVVERWKVAHAWWKENGVNDVVREGVDDVVRDSSMVGLCEGGGGIFRISTVTTHLNISA